MLNDNKSTKDCQIDYKFTGSFTLSQFNLNMKMFIKHWQILILNSYFSFNIYLDRAFDLYVWHVFYIWYTHNLSNG